jgi:hypothetical protein
MELTVWVSAADGKGMLQVSNARARAAGLRFKSTEEVVRETLEWAKSRPVEHEMRAGLKAEREAELLEALSGS